MAIISKDPIQNSYGMTMNDCYIRVGKNLQITATEDNKYVIITDIETFLNKEARLEHREPMSKQPITFTIDNLGDNIYEYLYREMKLTYPNYTDDNTEAVTETSTN
jgi:hypothetical protein